MFFKTLKHDLKNSFKDYSMLYLVMLIFTIVFPFMIRSEVTTLQTISVIFMTIIFTGAFVLMLVNGVSFLKRRLFNEGAYLNLTLPVKTETTLFSKVLTVSIWQYITILFIFICAIIFGLSLADVTFTEFFKNNFFRIFSEMIKNADWFLIISNLVLFLVESLMAITIILLGMTLVNTSWFKRPNYFLSILFIIIMFFVKSLIDDGIYSLLNIDTLTRITKTAGVYSVFTNGYQVWAFIAYELVVFGLAFMATSYLFKNKIEL